MHDEVKNAVLQLGHNQNEKSSVSEANVFERISAESELPAETALNPALTFEEAVPIWKELRNQRWNLKDRTHEAHSGYLKSLAPYFDELRLSQITERHFREYQIARMSNALRVSQSDGSVIEVQAWKRCPGKKLINSELNALSMLLNALGLWKAIQPFYCPFPRKKWSPRHKHILDEDEEVQFFERASRDPEIMFAFCIALLSSHTTATGCEVRGLRLESMIWRESRLDANGNDLNPSYIEIPEDAVKNDDRPRTIPLTPTAKWAAEQLYRRALQLGSVEPQHFLIPFRVANNRYDPTRRPSRWFLRDNWKKLRDATGFKNVLPHDMRHLCITKMLENGAKPDTVREIAGHVSPEMMEYYSHVRRREKYAALILIDSETAQKKKAPQNIKWAARNKSLTGS